MKVHIKRENKNMNECPNFGRNHKFTYSVGSGVKNDFEIVEFGKSASETLYRRVEYTYLACPCGQTKKNKVLQEDIS